MELLQPRPPARSECATFGVWSRIPRWECCAGIDTSLRSGGGTKSSHSQPPHAPVAHVTYIGHMRRQLPQSISDLLPRPLFIDLTEHISACSPVITGQEDVFAWAFPPFFCALMFGR